MTVVARRVAAVPRRTSVETWERIIELLSDPDSTARTELQSVTSVAAMLIAEEYTKDAPIRVSGGGPQLRLYTLHGDEAIDHDLADEGNLPFNPTDGDAWTLSLPAGSEDVAVAQAQVARSSRIQVRDLSEPESSSENGGGASSELSLDLGELERP